MNNIVVAKFGGSSLANADQFRKVKSIVDADPRRRYVVPSAPGKRDSRDFKITDLLYLCQAHVKNGIPFDDVFKLISQRYIDIVNDLSIDINIEDHLNKVKEDIANGASEDYAASRGEYLNGLVLAKFLGFEFIDAAELVLFDDKGNFNLDKTVKVVNEKLANIEKAVIPGFYGHNEKRGIITFSRSGSDISGSIIAAGVNAELYENWTDVSGFLMSDPRIVENAKPIEKVTYRELRELAYMGATVLHEEAIFPVKLSGIPINIKNTNRPQDAGTLIISDLGDSVTSGTITGIAGKKAFTVITIEKALMNSELGFCRKILSILEMNQVSFESMPAGIDSLSLVIADSELKDKQDRIIEEIKKQCNPDSVDVYPNMAIVATVGRGMAYSPGIAAKIFTALAKEKINIRMIDQGSSEINILVGVETADFEKAIKTIYKAFN
ncbi:MAG: aspartate kinase [Clostridiaceae bacterium]